ncbi:MAG TPA: hypothetical protein VMV70_08475 [Gallionella sp.]|nr:hypothetical protein [Gallionella sp.]
MNIVEGVIMAMNPIGSGASAALPLQQTNQSQQDKLAMQYKQSQQAKQFQQVQQAQKALDAQKQQRSLQSLQTPQGQNIDVGKTIGVHIDIKA